MSLEQSNTLYTLAFTVVLWFYLCRVSIDADGTLGGRWLLRALDSSAFRTRWSASPIDRVRRMSYALIPVAILELVIFILDPKPRYVR